MPTNTSGGTTTSFNNTPQAKDDYTTAYEDSIFTFDVMANDLGGNAKVLWSIDDSTMTDDSGNGTYDLLTKDAALVRRPAILAQRSGSKTESSNMTPTRSIIWRSASRWSTSSPTRSGSPTAR